MPKKRIPPPYACERCGKQFEALDRNGDRVPQKRYLAQSHKVLVGRKVFIVPRLCYTCQDNIDKRFGELVSGPSQKSA